MIIISFGWVSVCRKWHFLVSFFLLQIYYLHAFCEPQTKNSSFFLMNFFLVSITMVIPFYIDRMPIHKTWIALLEKQSSISPLQPLLQSQQLVQLERCVRLHIILYFLIFLTLTPKIIPMFFFDLGLKITKSLDVLMIDGLLMTNHPSAAGFNEKEQNSWKIL